jgi:hypothetical protein
MKKYPSKMEGFFVFPDPLNIPSFPGCLPSHGFQLFFATGKIGGIHLAYSA